MATILVNDGFNRVVASGAGTADGGTDTSLTWSTIIGVDANVNVNGSALVMTADTSQWRGQIGTVTTENIEIYADVNNFGPATAVFKEFNLYPRYLDANNHYFLRWINDQDTTDNGALEIWRVAAGVATRLSFLASTRLTSFSMRARVETATFSNRLALKMWTGAEPSAFDRTINDTASDRIMSGNFAMRLGNFSTTSDMEIDNFIVTTIDPSPKASVAGTVPQHTYF